MIEFNFIDVIGEREREKIERESKKRKKKTNKINNSKSKSNLEMIAFHVNDQRHWNLLIA